MKLPEELLQLVAEGVWPGNREQAIAQNRQSLIPPSAVGQFAPEEENIFLYPPPFRTVRDQMDGQPKSFWFDPRSATHELDPSMSLILGDFGMGSDAAIILDYRDHPSNPRVMRLRWGEGGNHWVQCFETFSELASILRDSRNQPSKPSTSA